MTYGIEIWGTASKTSLKPILTLQNRIVRIITSAHYRAHAPPIFKSLKLLPFHDIYELSIAKIMLKIIKETIPTVLNYMFTFNMNIHDPLTRQRHKLRIPAARTNLLQKTLRYKGVQIWNDIEEKISSQCSLQIFKKKVKDYLLNR